tara:strand:+ start:838 stop:2352 length:1515 start_codon:yes stop_codon:yes gene_type:complete
MTSKQEIINFFNNKKYNDVIENYNQAPFSNDHDILLMVGVSYSLQSKYSDAIKCFQSAYKINKSIDSLYNIAITYALTNDADKAIKIYLEIIALDKNHLSSYINLSDIYIKNKKYNLAINILKDIVPKNINNLLLNYNYAVALSENKLYEEAIEFFDKTLNVDSSFSDAIYNRANCLKNIGMLDDAIDIYKNLINHNNNDHESKFNLGICSLLKGDLKNGLDLYENRFNLKENYTYSYLPKGKSLLDNPRAESKSTILVIYEQGFGDSINFSCYLNFLKNNFNNVICLIQKELLSLFEESFDCRFFTDSKVLPRYDYHIFMASLPLYVYRKGGSLQNQTSYLKVSDGYKDKWKSKINLDKKNIGISWHTTKSSLLDKSIDDLDFLNNLSNKFNYFCLHNKISSKGKEIINQMPHIYEYCDEINDFHDTASICSLMDYVITIDTSVAHLSSALGIKTQLLLAHVPDWRWKISGRDTIWYKNTNILRQKKDNDWKSLLESLFINLR